MTHWLVECQLLNVVILYVCMYLAEICIDLKVRNPTVILCKWQEFFSLCATCLTSPMEYLKVQTL